MADAVFVIDAASLRFVDYNLAACQTYGYLRQQMLQMSPLDRGKVARRLSSGSEFLDVLAELDRNHTAPDESPDGIRQPSLHAAISASI